MIDIKKPIRLMSISGGTLDVHDVEYSNGIIAIVQAVEGVSLVHYMVDLRQLKVYGPGADHRSFAENVSK